MYLCDKYKKHDWYPTELKERARVHEYAHWQHANLRATGSMLFRTKVKFKFFYLIKYQIKFLLGHHTSYD
jgi:glutathione S-transferase